MAAPTSEQLREGMAAHRRSDLAEKVLLAMIARIPPQAEWGSIDTNAWARGAFEFADSFIAKAS